MYWDDYVGADENVFRRRVCQLVDTIMNRDVSGVILSQSKARVLRAQPLDSEQLIAEYRRALVGDNHTLYRWDQLADTLKVRKDYPRVHILATHLNTGRACAYTPDGFVIPAADDRERHSNVINALRVYAESQGIGHQEIVRAVAASSAFPPIFSPVPLVAGDASGMNLLTDGGAYDNSGVTYMQSLYESGSMQEPATRMVILSDAGREFPTEVGSDYNSLLALAMRVTDTQGNRLAQMDSDRAAKFFQRRRITVWPLSVHEEVRFFAGRPRNHSARVQELLRTIRTEFDRFSREEVLVLYRQGYLVAQQVHAKNEAAVDLTGLSWAPVDCGEGAGAAHGRPEDLDSIKREELERRLSASHLLKKQQELGVLLPRWIREWLLYKYRWVIAGALVGLSVLLCTVALISFNAGRADRLQEAVAAQGQLAVSGAEPYSAESWAAKLPTLRPVLQQSSAPRFAYTLTTEPIGVLTRGLPHQSATLHFELTGKLEDARLFLFLEKTTPSGNFFLVAMEEAGLRKIRIPLGDADDRVSGLIVCDMEISALLTTLNRDLSIELESP
ncbi:MAG TPA: patatin-like phospholipase family protein, partial [Pirellulales bacterium]|nr:patatin-like phospholipase family protein [Pirellulales bacterium]